MANMISNNNNNNSNTSIGVGVVGGNISNDAGVLAYSNIKSTHKVSNNENNNQVNSAGVTNLRDVCNFLQTPANEATLAPGVNPYDHIIEMLCGLDLQDDGILLNRKIKSIETFYCNVVLDENMLCESMEYINDIALGDHETALKFAILFSSHDFDALAMNETKVRSAMIKILETNFLNADTYRQYDKNRLYNSITLLGEYYHRVRLANNTPIAILGESLLSLLIREVEDLAVINVKLAKLLLSQITLNGDNMRVNHKDDLTQLLFHIRRNLIEQPQLKAKVKALLLMTLDLYYSNFKNLGKKLEEMYTKYLVQEDPQDDNDDEDNNIEQDNNNLEQQKLVQQPEKLYVTSQHSQQQTQQQSQNLQSQKSLNYENGELNSSNRLNEMDAMLSTKKWSEQVCEDSFYENEFINDLHNSSSGTQDALNNSYTEQHEQLRSSSSRSFDRDQTDRDSVGRDSRRSYQPRSSPRPLKQDFNSDERSDAQWHNDATNGEAEDRDQTKPLPRWRTTRFNRDGKDHPNERQHHLNHHHQQQQHRRFSNHFDDDRQSERSEGGSIRLYSVNDRLKHSQEKFEKSNINFNNIANSNWDRQSQRDDRSERSYLSNYERGNQRRGTRHYNNNRQNYDKPPRFQKNQQHQHHHQQQQHQQQQNQQQQPQQRPHSPINRDHKIQSETWRRSAATMGNNYRENNNSNNTSAYRTNGRDDANSRSSSRARTLPRPAKSKMDDSMQNSSASSNPTTNPNPNGNYQEQRPNQRGGGGNNGGPRNQNQNKRYGSQNSLASEGSNTFDRRLNQQRQNYRNRSQDWDDDRHSVHSLRAERTNETSWHNKNIDESELVRNAQQTTKYMNYLSGKK